MPEAKNRVGNAAPFYVMGLLGATFLGNPAEFSVADRNGVDSDGAKLLDCPLD